MPPPGYAPCYEALLPRDRMRIEPIKEYKHDFNGVRNLLGPTLSLTHTSFTPCPVDTVQVKAPNLRSDFDHVIKVSAILFPFCLLTFLCCLDCVATSLGAYPREAGREYSRTLGCHPY